MPAVLIHGVPDTFHVWEALERELSRDDFLSLALPGFGAPIPAGFSATKEAYVDWIIARLEEIGEPVDLVGHDWGCMFTVRITSLRPDLIRTWAAGSGPVSSAYDWHPLAKIWQSPATGEKWMREAKISDWATALATAGVSNQEATEAADRIDDLMKNCILRLYRSAIHVGEEWQPSLANIRKPGLVFWGEHDSACPVRFAELLAKDGGARNLMKMESDHWVILEKSAEIAHALEEHWSAAND